MAQRRMFSKTVTESDAFTDMPLSTQALYFHLGMSADDDGFLNNPKRVQRCIGAADDDLSLLVVKGFIIPFESGVVAVAHWRVSNYIRPDRYNQTHHQSEAAQLVECDGVYRLLDIAPEMQLGIPNDVPKVDPDKGRLGKNNQGEDALPGAIAPIVSDVVGYLNERTGKRFSDTAKATVGHIMARAKEGYSLDDFKSVIDIKLEQWGRDANMSRYLRPETLFGPKFESYLNEGMVKQDDYSEYDC